MQKDNFSKQSDIYAQFRPTYPMEVFEYLKSIVNNKNSAWDCATGNGQMAIELANFFETVFATDISENQLANATKKDNIFYSKSSAEQTTFLENTFDLITVAQAIHWFDFDKFYAETRRIAKKEAILFVIGYSMPRFEGKIDEILQDFYHQTTAPYWDPERKHIDSHYTTIPFPFREVECPKFSMDKLWTIEMAEGYFNSWSAIQHFIKKNGYNPVNEMIMHLKEVWNGTEKVKFPLFTKVGIIDK